MYYLPSAYGVIPLNYVTFSLSYSSTRNCTGQGLVKPFQEFHSFFQGHIFYRKSVNKGGLPYSVTVVACLRILSFGTEDSPKN